MSIETDIKQTKFRNPHHRMALNLLYTTNWLSNSQACLLKPYDLTTHQFNVLRILKGKHPEQMCVKDIANRMIEKNSNVPRIIDRLADKDLVKREQGCEDARQTVMSLTEAGIQILENSTKQLDAMWNDSMPLSEPEAKALNSLLEKITAAEK